jgi:sulfonate transport system permease protein
MSSQAIELKDIAPYRTKIEVVRGAGPAAARPQPGRRRRSPGRVRRAAELVIFPLLVVAVWFFLASRQILPANILPGPLAVLRTFRDLVTGTYGERLSTHLVASLWRVARGAAIGIPAGLALGLALGFSPTFESWFGPLFRTIAQIPSIALIPLLVMVLGIDDRLKLFIMAKACVIPLAFTTADGIRNIPAGYREVGTVFRLRRWTVISRIILPGALPSIFTGVRQGLAHVWVALVAVEVLASADGIGYLMTWGRLIFQLDVVMVCVAIIGLIGFLLDFGMRRLETRLLAWRGAGT